MITIKTSEEIEILKEGGKRLATILNTLKTLALPGTATHEINAKGEALIKEGGDTPAFFNYQPDGASRPYPASVCVSVNDEVVHGIPNESVKMLKNGDIVSIDIGLIHRGLVTDAAITVPVGKVSEDVKKLLSVTAQALQIGINAAQGGNTVGDIGAAIEKFVKPTGFGIVRELCGHGVGYSVHEDPFVPNFGVKGRGAKLKPGMVIAIEPMLNLGNAAIVLDKDGYTYRTRDGTPSAHFEHTLVITESEPIVLTKI